MRGLIIFILGCMTALSPFSIDMYLPAFPDIARDFGTTAAEVSLSLSSYFIGLSIGQLIYGPMLDRFGRKRPLYVGLSIYVLASLACLWSPSIGSLVAWRLVQALGGCAAGVAAMAMVRDLFSVSEAAKVFSLLMLVLGTSPLFAPTIGGYLSTAFGWHSTFAVLAAMGLLLLITVRFRLPETRKPDPSVELRLGPIARGFWEIARDPRFYTYVLSGAIAFSGMFVYLAGSSVIFMGHFGVSAQVYGWIFAIIAGGFVVSSQLNVVALKKWSSHRLLTAGLATQSTIALVFALGAYFGLFSLWGTVLMFSLFTACFGFTNPNSGSLALAPFGHAAGRASAMMGFLQMGVGAIASTSVGLLNVKEMFPVIVILAVTSSLGLLVLTWGRSRIRAGRSSE